MTSTGCGGGILFFVLVDAYILRLLFRRRGKDFSWIESIEFQTPWEWILFHFIAFFITGSIFVVLLLLVKLSKIVEIFKNDFMKKHFVTTSFARAPVTRKNSDVQRFQSGAD